MARRERTGARQQLGAELDADLADLSEAFHGAPVSRLIRRAVKDFVERTLEQEPAVRRRFDIARRERLGKKGENVRLLRGDC